MKKNLIALSLIAVMLILPVVIFAQPSGGASLESIINGIKRAAWMIFGAIAVVCFIMAGIQFLSSRGDADKLTEARSSVLWGVAGVVVGIIAYSIVSIVESFI